MREKYGASEGPNAQIPHPNLKIATRAGNRFQRHPHDASSPVHYLRQLATLTSNDEAITTPTEESVRRAMAIQLIINRIRLAMNENLLRIIHNRKAY